jgi:hypothetical protein
VAADQGESSAREQAKATSPFDRVAGAAARLTSLMEHQLDRDQVDLQTDIDDLKAAAGLQDHG